nr:phosphoribosylformylglycinamidine synthase subunit PurS [Ferroacidibacillus organovorans]
MASIRVTLKESVLDPQGSAVVHALHSLSFTSVSDVRIGKYMEVSFHADDEQTARAQVLRMCDQLLTNPVIETYSFTLAEVRE